ncbi:MAG: ATP-binding protein [Verrucomicrobiales bacterium]
MLRPRAAGNDALECPFEWVAQGRQSAAPQCATLSHESIGITADFYDRRQPAVFSARGALGTARGAATILAVPISAGDSSFGLLCVDSANPERRWTREDAALLGMVGDLFVTAIRRQRAEEDKQRLQMQLNQSQKMEAVGKLSGGIAHDLNNMLLPVIGYSDMLLARVPENSPDALELLEIRRAAEHAASLTRQLLAFSKKQVVKKTTTGINDVIQKMGKILDRVIGENIKIHFNLSEGLPPVLADPSQMEQVIMNLVVNARDAMPEGGSVSIRTRQVDTDSVPAKLISGAKPNGAFVEIIVRDTGRGIPKEIMDEIFDPFFTTKGHEGTGLGLHVVRSILEEHSGGIRVESYPGEGSEFHLFLPATSGSQPFAQAPRSSEAGYASTSAASPLPPAETPSPAVTRPPAETRGSGERILLVEDEESVIRFVARALKQHGYEVIEAMCVRDALDTFAEHGGRFDLVFSDAVLPDGNGVALLDQFLKERPDLPVVLSSGYTDKRSLLELAKERDIRFLQKPYALPLLFQTVRDALLNEGKAALA